MAFKTVVEDVRPAHLLPRLPGKIAKGESYTNQRTGKKMRFGRLVRMHADEREDVDMAEAGDIVAVVGVDCASGDTFCGDGVNVALESIFVPEPVIRLSIEPMKRDGADRLSKALERFRREDPTFRVMTDQESGQTLIAGMGQLHLEVYVERIRREYKCECLIGEPKVAYRECPTKAIEFNFRHKKQTGGSGQYAHVVGRLEPLAGRRDRAVRIRQRSHAGAHSEGIHQAGRRRIQAGTRSKGRSASARSSACGRSSKTAATTTSTRRKWRSTSAASTACVRR